MIDTRVPKLYVKTRAMTQGTPRAAFPTPDGRAVLFLRATPADSRQSLLELDVTTGNERVLFDTAQLSGIDTNLSTEEKARRERLRLSTRGVAQFELSPDGNNVLVPAGGQLFVVRRETGEVRELPVGRGSTQDARLSPDGTLVAYVKDYDLWVIPVDASAPPRRLTTGGSETVTHGLAEFVAQEELDRMRGYFFSPDGAAIVYERADQTKVERLALVDLAHPERPPNSPHYPRAGTPNAEVTLGIVATKGGPTTWITWDQKAFPYVMSVTWPKKGQLTVHVRDRLQRQGRLLAVDPVSGQTHTLVSESDADFLPIDASVPAWLPDGSGFLFSSDRTGASILELRGRDGALIRELTGPQDGYRNVLGFDATGGHVLFVGGADPVWPGLFRASLASGQAIRLSPEGRTGTYSMGHAKGVAFGAESNLAVERGYVLRDTSTGKVVAELRSLGETPKPPNLELLRIGPDEVRVAMIRPRSFTRGRVYPVIDAAYGGPGHLHVTGDGTAYGREQWLADQVDAIVVRMDGRGTPERGRAWERALSRKLGDVPLQSHVETLEYLFQRYPELDRTRVGIYGWSFGGYLAALAVLRRPDVFHVAAVGAPVADWRDYDTAYTERYLGLPGDNKSAYDQASVLTWARSKPAPATPLRKMLIVHGTADDNVFFSHSLKLTDALARAGRPFDFIPLLGQTHMLTDEAMAEVVYGSIARLMIGAFGTQNRPPKAPQSAVESAP